MSTCAATVRSSIQRVRAGTRATMDANDDSVGAIARSMSTIDSSVARGANGMIRIASVGLQSETTVVSHRTPIRPAQPARNSATSCGQCAASTRAPSANTRPSVRAASEMRFTGPR